MDVEAYLQRVGEAVDQHGVCVQCVGAGADHPEFAYTVGLFMVGHPEFVVVGLPAEQAPALLNALARSVLRGNMRYTAGERVHGVIPDATVQFAAVSQPESYARVAYELRNRRRPAEKDQLLPALQVILPDTTS